jgi:hypothetical protein
MQQQRDVLTRPLGRDYVRTALILISTISLLAIYFDFLNHFISPIVLGPMNGLEAAIFYTMLLRVLALTIVPYLRKLHPQIKILIFSFEAFLLCLVILGIIFAPNSGLDSMLADILTSWLGATFVFLTPYSIYELALVMSKSTSLTSVFITSAPLLAVILFLGGLVSRFPNPPSGIAGFGATIITSIRGQPSLAGSATSSGNAFISSTSIIFFLSMIIYVGYTLNKSAPNLSNDPKYHYALGLMLVGTLIMYVWLGSSTSLLKGDIFEIFSVPAVIISVVVWAVCRPRRHRGEWIE